MTPPPIAQRAFVDTEGPDDNAIIEGLRWVRDVARNGGYRVIGLFVPTLGQIESLERSLGEDVVRRLKRDRRVVVEGITINVFTEKQIPHAHSNGPVLAIWVDDKQLLALDDLQAPAICAIPWLRTDLTKWRRTWNPVDLRGTSPASGETVLSPAVVGALESLTASVNLSTGLTNPSDKASAIETFQDLIATGEIFDPVEIQAWATREGWIPKYAEELAELAGKILEGKRVVNPRKRRV